MTVKFTSEQGRAALLLMLRSRLFEEKIAWLFATRQLHGTTHLAIGQEAVHAGVSPALDPDDWIVTTHRCHGHTLAKGASIESVMAEMFGLADGLSCGLGGSMHLVDIAHHNAGSSAVVGSSVAIATGIALQLRRTGSPHIVVGFFGDAASSRGIVHESMNMASIWNLPVLFFCENNQYGMSSRASDMVSVDSIAVRGIAYTMESATVDGNDVEAVYGAVQRAASYIRNQRRPYFLEAQTYRLSGHSKNDERVYRSREEEELWRTKDPIIRFKDRMIERAHLSEDEYAAMEREERDRIDAVAETLTKRSNRLSIEQASRYVYAPAGGPACEQ